MPRLAVLTILRPKSFCGSWRPGRSSPDAPAGTPREIALSVAPTPVTGCDAGSSAALPVTALLPPCASSPPLEHAGRARTARSSTTAVHGLPFFAIRMQDAAPPKGLDTSIASTRGDPQRFPTRRDADLR